MMLLNDDEYCACTLRLDDESDHRINDMRRYGIDNQDLQGMMHSIGFNSSETFAVMMRLDERAIMRASGSFDD